MTTISILTKFLENFIYLFDAVANFQASFVCYGTDCNIFNVMTLIVKPEMESKCFSRPFNHFHIVRRVSVNRLFVLHHQFHIANFSSLKYIQFYIIYQNIWPKFRFLNENFDFWWKFQFLNENFDFWWKFRFLMKISLFDENFDFWWKFRFMMEISIFDENFDFWWKFRFLMEISFFDENFDVCLKFRLLTEISIFDSHKFRFSVEKILIFSQRIFKFYDQQ